MAGTAVDRIEPADTNGLELAADTAHPPTLSANLAASCRPSASSRLTGDGAGAGELGLYGLPSGQPRLGAQPRRRESRSRIGERPGLLQRTAFGQHHRHRSGEGVAGACRIDFLHWDLR